jgi:hypothetical protein
VGLEKTRSGRLFLVLFFGEGRGKGEDWVVGTRLLREDTIMTARFGFQAVMMSLLLSHAQLVHARDEHTFGWSASIRRHGSGRPGRNYRRHRWRVYVSGVGTVERPWKLAIIELELAQEHTASTTGGVLLKSNRVF